MLYQDCPDDFLLGTGESYMVREVAETPFREVGINLEWIGSGMNEAWLSESMTRVEVSTEFFRPLESSKYCADHTKAKKF